MKAWGKEFPLSNAQLSAMNRDYFENNNTARTGEDWVVGDYIILQHCLDNNLSLLETAYQLERTNWAVLCKVNTLAKASSDELKSEIDRLISWQESRFNGQTEEKEMEQNESKQKVNELLMMMREDYSCVEVMFHVYYPEQIEKNLTPFIYRYPKDWELVEGDLVVVPTGGGKDVNLEVARVSGLLSADDVIAERPGIQFKWVMSQIDTEQYDLVTEQDAKIIRAVKKAQRRSVVAEAKESLKELLGAGEFKKLTGGKEEDAAEEHY